jgi:hypothetical protein
MDEAKTLILRFRDLVTAPGNTIRLHAEIRREKGYVWWGWWSKGGETVPLEVFSSLAKIARSDGGLELFLFDSGQTRLHRARCTEIHWERTAERAPSPEIEATPEYYREQRYLTWFRLSEVDEEPVEDACSLLQGLAYVRVDGFFTSNASKYTPFYGKRIASPGELRQQDRSIWFVRDGRVGDRAHEIELLGSRQVEPAHFPEGYVQTMSTRLLWVSDLHFGKHAFPLDSTPTGESLAIRITQALSSADLGGVLVSGDLTWQAEPGEYAQARSFLEGVASFARLENYQIAVCPGNHDVRFSIDPAAKGEEVTYASDAARGAYSDFYRDLFYQSPNEYLSCGRRFLLGGAVPVEIVSLNSSLLEQSPGLFQGHGFVGDPQLRNAAERMGWSASQTLVPFRILMVHHHLLPVTYRESPREGSLYSVVLDAEALSRWIVEHRIRLVLHGHMHDPFHACVSRHLSFDRLAETGMHSFHVCGLGSTGVAAEHLGESARNMFGVLEFSRESLEISYHSVHPVNPSGKLRTLTIPLTD